MNKKTIAIALGVGLIFFSTSYNHAYFRDYAYQDNIVKIDTPPVEENDKSSFETTAVIDGEYFNQILINLDEYFDINSNFRLSIKEKYGVFQNKFFTITNQVGKGVNIYLTVGEEFKLTDFQNELPTLNKLDVIIKYKENNEVFEKQYSAEFIADPDNTNILRVYFYN